MRAARSRKVSMRARASERERERERVEGAPGRPTGSPFILCDAEVEVEVGGGAGGMKEG